MTNNGFSEIKVGPIGEEGKTHLIGGAELVGGVELKVGYFSQEPLAGVRIQLV